jgi:hypothetical protein
LLGIGAWHLIYYFISLKEYEHCIDRKGEQGCPKHDGDGKWVDRFILRNTESLAETRVAKIPEPSAEDTKDGATNDIAREMYTEINARIAVKHSVQHHCSDQRTPLVKATDPDGQAKAIGGMRRYETIGAAMIVVDEMQLVHDGTVV